MAHTIFPKADRGKVFYQNKSRVKQKNNVNENMTSILSDERSNCHPNESRRRNVSSVEDLTN